MPLLPLLYGIVALLIASLTSAADQVAEDLLATLSSTTADSSFSFFSHFPTEGRTPPPPVIHEYALFGRSSSDEDRSRHSPFDEGRLDLHDDFPSIQTTIRQIASPSSTAARPSSTAFDSSDAFPTDYRASKDEYRFQASPAALVDPEAAGTAANAVRDTAAGPIADDVDDDEAPMESALDGDHFGVTVFTTNESLQGKWRQRLHDAIRSAKPTLPLLGKYVRQTWEDARPDLEQRFAHRVLAYVQHLDSDELPDGLRIVEQQRLAIITDFTDFLHQLLTAMADAIPVEERPRLAELDALLGPCITEVGDVLDRAPVLNAYRHQASASRVKEPIVRRPRRRPAEAAHKPRPRPGLLPLREPATSYCATDITQAEIVAVPATVGAPRAASVADLSPPIPARRSSRSLPLESPPDAAPDFVYDLSTSGAIGRFLRLYLNPNIVKAFFSIGFESQCNEAGRSYELLRVADAHLCDILRRELRFRIKIELACWIILTASDWIVRLLPTPYPPLCVKQRRDLQRQFGFRLPISSAPSKAVRMSDAHLRRLLDVIVANSDAASAAFDVESSHLLGVAVYGCVQARANVAFKEVVRQFYDSVHDYTQKVLALIQSDIAYVRRSKCADKQRYIEGLGLTSLVNALWQELPFGFALSTFAFVDQQLCACLRQVRQALQGRQALVDDVERFVARRLQRWMLDASDRFRDISDKKKKEFNVAVERVRHAQPLGQRVARKKRRD